ncbi:MAG: tagatose 1,6-diphosphate aldolase [Chloroflexota bacterium]|nr:MAG: tagatose 1,6-diphosphate aldolase [Chloroflexota bacterium]
MKELSPSKRRGLQACATNEGIFSILALDHRDSLRAIIAPDAPQAVRPSQLSEIKLAVIEHLAGAASAVLLDPVYSLGQAITSGRLPGHVGVMAALEEHGYLSDPYHRQTPLLAGWSAAKAKRLGVNGIKLLLFYHPEAGAATEAQERLVRSIAADCERYEMPFFLEPISYSIKPEIKKDSPEFATQRRRIIIDTVRRLSPLGPDVMKVEFPLDTRYESDPGVWAEACVELSEASPIPWTLLSAGESFEVFKQQLQVACRAGCSGFVGGRSIWQEAARLTDAAQADFLSSTARRRFLELQQVALAEGTPWTRHFIPEQVDEYWFQQY